MVAETALVGHGAAVRGLAERWLEVVAEGEKDFACSPAGLWLAMAAVAAGADGETAAELRGVLGVAGEEAAGAATAVARELGRTDALAVATGVWGRVPVYRAFRESLPDIGFGQLDPEAGVEAIDAWVREATDGLIERLPLTLAPDTLLLLVNALLLKARWETPFEGGLTSDRPFTDAAGVRHQVATMHRTVRPADAWRVAGEVSVVELRCRAGDGAGEGGLPAVVRFVLGPVGAPPARVLAAAWAGPGERAGFEADLVSVALPRLALRSKLNVLPHLARLGMRAAASRAADFSRLSPEPLLISQVVQECVLKVAEQGVEAAAVTAIAMRAGSAVRPRIHPVAFDRPFGVVVLDGGGTVPLFTAWQASAPQGE
ncbi:serpin family protein [Streptomyces sp. 6N223]|uniref:serpin family protein n=1 Tax=Streptomyces sp. 6N223 TaxID=3457412 RepID=UPI003FD43662